MRQNQAISVHLKHSEYNINEIRWPIKPLGILGKLLYGSKMDRSVRRLTYLLDHWNDEKVTDFQKRLDVEQALSDLIRGRDEVEKSLRNLDKALDSFNLTNVKYKEMLKKEEEA